VSLALPKLCIRSPYEPDLGMAAISWLAIPLGFRLNAVASTYSDSKSSFKALSSLPGLKGVMGGG
jgi:hypothetical protein